MTRTFESHEELAVWELERQILEQQIRSFERHARTNLKSLRCPVDPVAIYAILAGETPMPGRARTRARDRQRVLHAMHLLLAITEIRAHLGPTQENAAKAAAAALRAGYLANAIDAAFGAEVRARKRVRGQKGGKERATRRRASQTAVSKRILKHAKAWRDSDGEYLNPINGKEYRSAAAYVKAREPELSLSTIRAALTAAGFEP